LPRKLSHFSSATRRTFQPPFTILVMPLINDDRLL
jgi:hypothetical protein